MNQKQQEQQAELEDQKKTEKNVLGLIFKEPSILQEAREYLTTSDYFQLPENKAIFESMLLCDSKGDDIEATMVAMSLRNNKECSAIKDNIYEYIGSLEDDAKGLISYYAKKLIENYVAKQILSFGSTTQSIFKAWDKSDASNPKGNIELKVELQNMIDKCQDLQSLMEVDKKASLVRDLIGDTIIRIEQIEQGKIKREILPTGIPAIDNITGGLVKGEYNVIAARPSVGKSSLAVNIACNAVLAKNPTLFFSYEVSNESMLIDRIIQSIAKVQMNKIRKNIKFTPNEWDKIYGAAGNIDQAGIFGLVDDSRVTISGIESITRAYHRKKGLELLVVDYSQLVPHDQKFQIREQHIASISRRLKALAKQLKIYTLFLYQLNRGNEKDQREPRISDLRESGQIEMDADVIMLLHSDDDMKKNSNLNINIAKNKNGETGDGVAYFNRQFTSFEEPTQEDFYG